MVMEGVPKMEKASALGEMPGYIVYIPSYPYFWRLHGGLLDMLGYQLGR
jgi:hypothetical protein